MGDLFLRKRDLAVLIIVLVTICHYSVHNFSSWLHLQPSWYVELSDTPIVGPFSPPRLMDADDDGDCELILIDKDESVKAYTIRSAKTWDSKDIYHPEELDAIHELQGSVACDGSREGLFCLSKDHSLSAADLSTSSLLWTAQLPIAREVVAEEASVLVNGDFVLVYLSPCRALRRCADKNPTLSRCCAQFLSPSERNASLSSSEFFLLALEKGDGSLVWQYTAPLSDPLSGLEHAGAVAEQQHRLKFHPDFRTFYLNNFQANKEPSGVKLREQHRVRRAVVQSLPSLWPHALTNPHAHHSAPALLASIDPYQNQRQPQQAAQRRRLGAGAGRGAGRPVKRRGRQAGEDSSDTAAKKQRLFNTIRNSTLVSGQGRPKHEVSLRMQFNAVVVKRRGGLSVHSLRNGQPLTLLPLRLRRHADVEHDLYAVDMNRDGSLEYVEVDYVRESSGGKGAGHCTLRVSSGPPPSSLLFDYHALCSSSLQHLSRLRNVSEHFTLPLALPLATGRRGLYLLTAEGVVFFFGPHGAMQWKVSTISSWSKSVHSATHFTPSFVSFHPGHSLLEEHLLAVGYDSLSMLNRDGSLLASAELPHPPILPPYLVDFDQDGLNDVVIVTENEVIGFRTLRSSSNKSMMAALIVALVMALFVFAVNIRFQSDANATPGNVKSWVKLSLARSTDEDSHLD